jgi:enoyl-CoA hydratase/carnithine racemase
MSHAMELLVKYETDEKVSIVTLNRPAKLNALSKELRVQLVDAFHKADDDPATCVVVLRAEGRSFCVGYDITGGDPDKEAWKHDALKWHENLREGLALEMMPWDMKKPVIASVQGHALGGGCELAMLCDITIAASDASFGEPEVRFSDVGPAIVMPWLIGFKKARELLYMGDSINAEEALRLGMVNKVVPVDELHAATLKFAKRMTLISPEALYAAKLSINRGAEAGGFRNAINVGLDVVAPLYAAKTEFGVKFDEIKKKDGLGAALKWRAAQFKE